LHLILLPLNCVRLTQLRATLPRVVHEDRPLQSLIPLMTRVKFRAGDVLFRKDDEARDMYLLLSGEVQLIDLGLTLRPGTLIGEIGLFSPSRRRTSGAACVTDCEFGRISDSRVGQLYRQNPAFGCYLMQLIIGRLERDYVALESRARSGVGAQEGADA